MLLTRLLGHTRFTTVQCNDNLMQPENSRLGIVHSIWPHSFCYSIRDYLEEQALKEAANEGEGAEDAEEQDGERKKKKRRGRQKKDKESQPAATALEAVKGELEARGLSKKLNYHNLEALFSEETIEKTTSAAAELELRDVSRRDKELVSTGWLIGSPHMFLSE